MRLTLTITFLALISLLSSAQDSLWVHVNIPVACIRDGKSHASEMTSQAIMGTPMLVLEDDGGEWLRLQGPDGYEGYMNVSSVARLSHPAMLEWRRSPRVTVTSFEESMVYADTTDISPRKSVNTLRPHIGWKVLGNHAPRRTSRLDTVISRNPHRAMGDTAIRRRGSARPMLPADGSALSLGCMLD